MEINELIEIIEKRKEKVSRAERVQSLLQKQKSILKAKQSLTDFREPVLDLHRINGAIETYENATAGKFIFQHSDGKPRFIELRPCDQETRDYAGKKVRWYTCHEDRPYAGWDEPIIDSESIMLGYEKTKAADLKYQERIEQLKQKSKMTWVYILIGSAVALAIVAFGYGNWVAPALERKAEIAAKAAIQALPPTASMVMGVSKRWIKSLQ